MRKSLLTVSLIALCFSAKSQILFSVDNSATFYVGEGALVYNGGGVQTKGTGMYDVRGNVMIEGTSSDFFRTLNAVGTLPKLDGGNFILRLNTPAAYTTSTYGQLFINGLTQGNITGVVDKEYRTVKHGTYQQIALPFFNKTISSLSGASNVIGTFGKTFTNTRYSQNEVLIWNNGNVVSENLSVSSATPKSTTYYMFGSSELDTGNPPAAMPANSPTAAGTVYTLQGVPYTNGVTELLRNAGSGINFGTGGSAVNSYNERYNSYLQDDWDYQTNTTNPWSVTTFGRNIYQFGNPYLTNLDLGMIGTLETGNPTDNNAISSIQGIRYDPGTVITAPNVGTYTTSAKFVNFTSGVPTPVGDVGLIIKPMQTFVIKLRDNNADSGGNKTLSFDNLRRFSSTPRAAGTNYSVSAKSSIANANTVKQLGIIALDAAGAELARTYYVVYPTATTGHTAKPTAQSTLGSENIMGTFEEHPITGGYDESYVSSYWLYINEANEIDFAGKAIPLALYNEGIKSLKFEIREDTQLIEQGKHLLSKGTGFYYKDQNGSLAEISQDQTIPVVGEFYSLFYGKPTGVLATDAAVKPSRTLVAYSKAVDNYIVRFDPAWVKADITVYDISGKVIFSQKNIVNNRDFELNLPKMNRVYIVSITSEKGEKVTSKIIR